MKAKKKPILLTKLSLKSHKEQLEIDHLNHTIFNDPNTATTTITTIQTNTNPINPINNHENNDKNSSISYNNSRNHSLIFPCNDSSIEIIDYSSWSFFQKPILKYQNISSTFLWNKKLINKINNQHFYSLPEDLKYQQRSLKKKLKPSKLTRNELLRRKYLISITPIVDEEVSIANASRGIDSHSFTLSSIH